MTSKALVAALLAIATTVAVLLVAIVARKVIRSVATARRRRVEPAARAVLLVITDGDRVVVGPRVARRVTSLALDALTTIRGEAGVELARFLREQGAVERSIRRLQRPGSVGRSRAAAVLGALRASDGSDALITALGDRSPEVRQVACRALARIGGSDAADAMLAALDRGALPAGQVAMGLVTIGGDAVEPARAALTRGQPIAQYVAAQMLGHMCALAAAPDLENVLIASGVDDVRIAATLALGAIGSPSSAAPLLAACGPDEPESVRAAAAQALGRVLEPSSLERLRAMLEEPGYAVPHAAAGALAALGIEGRATLVAAVAAGGWPARHAAEALALGDVAARSRRASAGRGAAAR